MNGEERGGKVKRRIDICEEISLKKYLTALAEMQSVRLGLAPHSEDIYSLRIFIINTDSNLDSPSDHTTGY